MKLFIKYMVSLRCKLVVKSELEKLRIQPVTVDLGVVEIRGKITAKQRQTLVASLRMWGLELLDDKKSILVEKIKNLVVEMIHYETELPKVNYSRYISQKLNYDYNYLSNIFSETKGITIQQFIILHKIERAKELLLYDELTLTEIADVLNYSSVQHLSHQFKKITGHTPSFYKSIRDKRKTNLENL